jgi:hypothetical protein
MEKHAKATIFHGNVPIRSIVIFWAAVIFWAFVLPWYIGSVVPGVYYGPVEYAE